VADWGVESGGVAASVLVSYQEITCEEGIVSSQQS
jgi:hypothetical protein